MMAWRGWGGVIATVAAITCARGNGEKAAAPSNAADVRDGASDPSEAPMQATSSSSRDPGSAESKGAEPSRDPASAESSDREAERGSADPAAGEAVASTPASEDLPRDELEGLTTEQLRAKWGEPDIKRGDRWTYYFPRHDDCVEQRIVMTLRLRGGKVMKAEQRREMTGDYCAPPDH